MHVAHGAHGVAVGGGETQREFPLGVGLVGIAQARRGAGGHAFAARPAGQGDQGDVALAERDGLGGMADMHEIGGTAGIGRIEMAQLQAHIVGHGDSAARRVAAAEIAVDIVLAKAGVAQRAQSHFGMQLR